MGKAKRGSHKVDTFPRDNMQNTAYVECGTVVTATEMFEWVAFFDADEFLILKEHDHIEDMLEECCSQRSLGVNRFIFNSNHWNLISPEPITKRFLYREASVHKLIKTIFRLNNIQKVNNDPDAHNFVQLENHSVMHDSNGNDITKRENFSNLCLLNV